MKGQHDSQAERLAGDPRVEVAAASRRIIRELATSAATPEAFARAAALVSEAAELLGRGAHEAAPPDLTSRFYADHSPVSGPLNPVAPDMRVAVDGTSVTGEVTYGPAHEATPGYVHGGIIAAGFDEIIGMPPGLADQPSMTGRLTVWYRSPTPVGQAVRYTGWIHEHAGRKITTKGELRVVADDRLCAEAEGLFIAVDPSVFARLRGERTV